MIRENELKPVLRSFKGWKRDISSINSYEEMPEEMKIYINFLNGFLGVPVTHISNGPGRDQLVEI
jgi:adenylosuccinate synthase